MLKNKNFLEVFGFFHQNQIQESDACEGEKLQVLYIMNLVSLLAFGIFYWLLMTPEVGVICNNYNFTKQYWINKQLSLRWHNLDAPGDIKPCLVPVGSLL